MKNSGIPLSKLPKALQNQVAAELLKHPRRPVKAKEQPATTQQTHILQYQRPAIDSPDVFSGWIEVQGLLAPVPEYRFDPDRRWRFDYAWPAFMIALEVEGGIWTGGRHTRGTGFLKDIEKYNRAALLGWRVFRCTPDTLCTQETLKLLSPFLKLT